MSAVPQAWPAIIGHHPDLVAGIAKARANGWQLFPMPALVAFLGRLERRYPGMQVSALRPVPLSGPGEWSVAVFVWGADAITDAGLLTADAVPQGRKRVCYSDSPLGKGFITARRKRGGLLEVWLHVPPSAPAQHPLAFFGAPSVRAAITVRPHLRLVVDNTRGPQI